MSQPVPFTAQIRMVFSVGPRTLTTGYYVRDLSGWDEAKLEAQTVLARGLFIAWSPEYPQDVILNQVVATDISQTQQTQYVNNDVPLTGDRATAVASVNNAPVLTLRTGVLGKSYTGRMYLPPPPEDEIDAVFIGSGFTSNIASTTTTFIEGAELGGQPWVIVSRYQFGVELPIPVTTVVKSADFASIKIGSQRRRVGRR